MKALATPALITLCSQLVRSALAVPVAYAQKTPEPGALGASPAGVLRVSFVAPLHSSSELARVLQDWLGRSDAPVVFDDTTPSELHAVLDSPARGSEVHIWLSLGAGGHLRLYAADSSTQRVLVRDLPTAAELDELERERVAQVVVALSDAFAAKHISSTRAEVAASLEPTTPSDASPPASTSATGAQHSAPHSAVHPDVHPTAHVAPQPARGIDVTAPQPNSGDATPYIDLSLGYQLRAAAAASLAHGLEGRIALGVHTKQLEYEADLLVRHDWQRELSNDHLQLQLEQTLLRVGASARLPLGAGLWWGLEAGPALFWQTVTAQATTNELSARAPVELRDLALTFATGPRLQTPWGWAQLGLNLNWLVHPPRYDVARAANADTQWPASATELGAFLRCGAGRWTP